MNVIKNNARLISVAAALPLSLPTQTHRNKGQRALRQQRPENQPWNPWLKEKVRDWWQASSGLDAQKKRYRCVQSLVRSLPEAICLLFFFFSLSYFFFLYGPGFNFFTFYVLSWTYIKKKKKESDTTHSLWHMTMVKFLYFLIHDAMVMLVSQYVSRMSAASYGWADSWPLTLFLFFFYIVASCQIIHRIACAHLSAATIYLFSLSGKVATIKDKRIKEFTRRPFPEFKRK